MNEKQFKAIMYQIVRENTARLEAEAKVKAEEEKEKD